MSKNKLDPYITEYDKDGIQLPIRFLENWTKEEKSSFRSIFGFSPEKSSKDDGFFSGIGSFIKGLFE